MYVSEITVENYKKPGRRPDRIDDVQQRPEFVKHLVPLDRCGAIQTAALVTMPIDHDIHDPGIRRQPGGFEDSTFQTLREFHTNGGSKGRADV